MLRFVLFVKETKLLLRCLFVNNADTDEGEEDGCDGYDFGVGHDHACDLGAGDEIGPNVDQDDVGSVEVANMFSLFLKSARRQCALCI